MEVRISRRVMRSESPERFGPTTGSSVASALLTAVDKHNTRNKGEEVLYLNMAAVDPAFTNERCSFWHFRFDAHVDMKMNALTDWVENQPDIKKVYPTNQDYSLGPADAKVTIVEYASLTCPHCAQFHTTVMPAIKKEFVETGKVRFVYRDFPLDRLALAAAMVARCAPEEKSLAVTSRLFETQPTWARAEHPIAAIAEVVAPLGLDQAAVDACVQNEDVAKPVLEQAIYGQETFEIRSTPTFIVNGEVLVGALSPEAFAEKIDAALK